MEQRRNGTKKRPARALFRILAILPLGLGLAGCASSGSHSGANTAGERYAPPSGATVYTTDALAQWEQRVDPFDTLRPEYARNDALLGRRDVTAITAADQWPQPLQPIERPVIFRLFQQDRSGFGGGYYDRGFDNRGFDRGFDRGNYSRGGFDRGGFDRRGNHADRRSGGSSGRRGVFRR